MAANAKQIAGDHYKKYGDLQPWDVVIKWNLGYLEGTALKYIARWRDKGGIDDIKKAIHFLEKLVEIHTSTSNIDPEYSSILAEFESKQSKPMDIPYGKRLYDAAETPKQPRNPNYPFDFDSLDKWVKLVEGQKALDRYHARDF